MNKKLRLMLSLILALTMVMGSVASAANMLYYNVTLEKEYTTPMTNESVDELIAEYNNGNEIAKLVNNKLVNYDEYRAAVIEVLQEALDSGKTEEEAIEAVVAAIPSIVEGLEEVELPEEELKVVEVSAIDKTIKLNVAVFEAEEGATADVAIFALNDKGEKATTALFTDKKAEIKDNVVTLDVKDKTFGDAEYVVVVKVGEEEAEVNVTIEFKAAEKLVADINKATAAQLATLLADEAYFTGFDVAKVDAYNTNNTKDFKTIAEVQKKVIDAAEATSEFEAFKTALLDDKIGEYAKYLVLKGQFSNVLDANMDDYMDAPIFENTGTVDLNKAGTALIGFDAVSDAIDVINLDAVVAGFKSTAFDKDAKPSELNADKTALEELALVNEKITATDGETKEVKLKAIDTQLAKIADALKVADAAVLEAEQAMADYATAKGTGYADVDEYKAVVAAIKDLVAEDLAEDTITTKAGDLGLAVTALEAKTEELTILEVALTALDRFAAAFGEDFAEETEYKAVITDHIDMTDVDNPVLKFENSGTIDTLKAAIEALDDLSEEWETYNAVMATEDAAEMRDLLFKFADANYVDLTSAQKLEFAERFIEKLDKEANYDAVKGLLGTEVTAYAELINDVNGDRKSVV